MENASPCVFCGDLVFPSVQALPYVNDLEFEPAEAVQHAVVVLYPKVNTTMDIHAIASKMTSFGSSFVSVHILLYPYGTLTVPHAARCYVCETLKHSPVAAIPLSERLISAFVYRSLLSQRERLMH